MHEQIRDETRVTAAALESYFNQMYGGSSRRLLLYQTTLKPSRTQLEVHVFSPANHESAVRYASAQVKKLRRNLLERCAGSNAVRVGLPQYVINPTRIEECAELKFPGVVDAVAVSRPGFDGTDKALIYLEYAGGARAYHLLRREGRWETDWYVELWGCG
jgi:hypothetical protein